MPVKIVCAGMLGLAVFFAAGGVAGATQRSSCSTGGLAAASGRYKVVSVTASGVSCSRARTVAQQVADDLKQGKPISVSGVQGFAINTTTCPGCQTKTQVALTYANGKVTILLGGKPSSSPAPVTGTGPLISA